MYIPWATNKFPLYSRKVNEKGYTLYLEKNNKHKQTTNNNPQKSNTKLLN